MTDNLNKFGNEISQFVNGLPYTHSYNSIGNLFLVNKDPQFNQTFFEIKCADFNYDYEKINSVNDLSFVDFKKEIKPEEYNESLVQELASESPAGDTTDDNSVTIDSNEYSELKSDVTAAKDIIIEYRIKAGEGNSESDFSDVFPYLPKN